ncbi:MAG: TIGR01212 family radical SAM protein [Eubacterium sp.]|nr:TIGR01212 family radical SAM protein [Eubacterium sp.]
MESDFYRVYSDWLKARYGAKVYKLPVNIAVSCPNRDGVLARGGCIYCGAKGGGNETLEDTIPVAEQVARNKAYIARRYKAKFFIPYFQSFTNTYLAPEAFEQAIAEAVGEDPQIVGLAVSTRPDCLNEVYLDILERISHEKGVDITVELGLQTANYKTLKKLNRGHSLADYIDTARRIKARGFALCSHVILDLPWDDREDVAETAGLVSAVKSDFVKCHALYIEEHTLLARMYRAGELQLFPKEEYIERCVLFLEHLDPEIVVQRIVGRAPESDSVITNWNTSWWKIKDMLLEKMAADHSVQGRRFHEKQKKIFTHCVKI